MNEIMLHLTLSILALIILIMTGFIFWSLLWTKLQEHDYEPDVIISRITLLHYIVAGIDLAKTSLSKSERKSIYTYIKWLIVIILCLPFALFGIYSNQDAIKCMEYSKYMKREFKGIIIDKLRYRNDSHWGELIILVEGDTINEIESPKYYYKLFSNSEIGDYIKKDKNDSLIFLTRDQKSYKFIPNKKLFCN